MASRIIQETQGSDNVYPVTKTNAVYNSDGKNIDDLLVNQVNYNSNGVSTTEQTLLDNYYTKPETDTLISNHKIQITTLWSGEKSDTGNITLLHNLSDYTLIILTGRNSGDELCTFCVPSSTLKFYTNASQPYDMGNNESSQNRYCNLYYADETTLTIKSIGRMTLLYVEGVK